MILIVGVLCCPESPRWLLKHNEEEDAAIIMGYMHNCDPHDDEVQEDIKEINELNALSDGNKLTLKELFTNGRDMNLWRFSVACGSQACQQITVSSKTSCL